MGECILLKSGGGNGSSDVTATKNQLLAGYTAITNDSDDDPIQGTIPVNSPASNQALNCGGAHTVKQGYHPQAYTITANSLASQTPGNAASGHILNGYSAWSNGVKVPGSIPLQGGSTITPGTAAKTAIAAGRYASGNIYVAGDPNLIAQYIKKGVPIFGVTGTWEGYVSSPLYFFNNGTWSNLQTTGMTNATVRGGILTLHSGSFGRLNQLVDLTGYNYIKIEATVPNATTHGYVFQIGISTSSSATTESNMTARKAVRSTSSSVVTGILDVSAYQGKYYIYAFDFFSFLQPSAGGTVDGYIYKIFLSKT